MKIPAKPIKELSPDEQDDFLATCNNHSELGVATELIMNSEIVYTSEEIASLLKEKMNRKSSSENSVNVTFLKKRT